MPSSFPSPYFAPDLVRADKLLIFVEDWPTETRFQNHNRRENETRADFYKGELGVEISMCGFECSFGLWGCPGLRWVGLGDCGFADLKATDPDLVVGKGETHNVIYKRLGFARPFRYAECVRKKFLNQEEMRSGGEVGGKR